MSLYLMGTYFHSLLGTLPLNSSLLGYFIYVLTIIGKRLVMIGCPVRRQPCPGPLDLFEW